MSDHTDTTLTDTERAALDAYLRGQGITDEPEKYDDGIHGWRCNYPDIYGRCDCFAESVDDLAAVVESIVAARVAAARANERAKWVAKLRVAEADLTPPHNCELLPDGHADPEMAAWVDGRHDAVDVLRALIEGADQ